MRSGWILLGFLQDFPPGLSEVQVAGRPLIVVRDEASVSVFDGVCPHRGARLAAGRLVAGAVICPFHGHAIALDGTRRQDDRRFCAPAYRTLEVAEMVFVLLGAAGGAPECGWQRRLHELRRDHAVVHGFVMEVPAEPETVVENAFDMAHFGPVHGVPEVRPPTPLAVDWREHGFACDGGVFGVAASAWDQEPAGTPVRIGYRSTAFGPGLVVSEQDGSRPYAFVVGAMPLAPRRSRVCVALLLPRDMVTGASTTADIEWLLGAMEQQLEADCAIWAGLPEEPVRNLVPGEEAIAGFWRFCELFEELDPRRCMA